MADINFTALALASFIFAISPGPGIVAVLATSVSRGAIIASAMSVGAVCGDMIYLLLAMVSLASIAQGIDEIMLVVRVLGGCYLGWIGYRQMISPPLNAAMTSVSGRSLGIAWGTGFMISLTNPKVIVFYLSFLPLFIDLGAIDFQQGIKVVVVMYFSVLAGPMVVVAIGKKARDVATGEVSGRWLNRITGLMMIAVGVALIAMI